MKIIQIHGHTFGALISLHLFRLTNTLLGMHRYILVRVGFGNPQFSTNIKLSFGFFLKIFHLSTRSLIRRKNMDLPSYDCVLCNASVEETSEHLFLGCPFALKCWNILELHISNPADLFISINDLKTQLQVPFVMDIIILLCW